MKANTEPLQLDYYYHIYNRGINGESVFKAEKDYHVFLKKYTEHISPIAETYAYCLLGNHFHLLVKIKSEVEISELLSLKYPLKIVPDLSKFISKQFSHLFNGYAQYFNNKSGRTGSLFENRFRRIRIDNDAYFSQLVAYIHRNPVKHGFLKDFTEYPHSSYHSLLHNKSTNLKRDDVLNWFGGREDLKKFHCENEQSHGISDYLFDFDL